MSNKATFFSKNQNTRNVHERCYTEERLEKAIKYINEENWEIDNTTNEEYAIIINKKLFRLSYEEMAELLCAMETCSLGNECFPGAKIKARHMREFLPETDY